MCFSAQASFIASGGLIALGGASFAVAKKEEKLIAVIPILFGIQQLFEGVQWLYLNTGTSSIVLGYAFLFFSFIVWPVYIPSVIYILDKKERGLLKLFIILGATVALYSISVPLTQSLFIQKINLCVNYSFINHSLQNFVVITYITAVFGPLFASSNKVLNWFGFIFAIFAIISWVFYRVNFVSVWCFFAALVSSMFFVYLVFKNKK